jgi:hypothetical protein
LVYTRAAPYHIPEYGILHTHCCENLKSYIEIYVVHWIQIFLYFIDFKFLSISEIIKKLKIFIEVVINLD